MKRYFCVVTLLASALLMPESVVAMRWFRGGGTTTRSAFPRHDARTAAATRIQSRVRGIQARKATRAEQPRRQTAARTLQRRWRQHALQREADTWFSQPGTTIRQIRTVRDAGSSY